MATTYENKQWIIDDELGIVCKEQHSYINITTGESSVIYVKISWADLNCFTETITMCDKLWDSFNTSPWPFYPHDMEWVDIEAYHDVFDRCMTELSLRKKYGIEIPTHN
jgi:hypothetical protein